MTDVINRPAGRSPSPQQCGNLCLSVGIVALTPAGMIDCVLEIDENKGGVHIKKNRKVGGTFRFSYKERVTMLPSLAIQNLAAPFNLEVVRHGEDSGNAVS